MKPPRNNLPARRIYALLLALAALLLCNLAAAYLARRQLIGGDLAWAVQVAANGGALALVGALFAVNRRALVAPIRGIAAWASRIRQGDFSARLGAGPAPLYALTDDINRLAEWLESLAESKNRELLEQAARLKTQTHLARLLYDITGDFSHAADADAGAELMQRSAQPMAEALDARRVEFFRFDGGVGDAEPARIAAAGAGKIGGENDDGKTGADENTDLRCVKIPLQFGATEAGECRVWFAADRFPLPDEFSQLLYTLGRNIAMAVERIAARAESARLASLRERAHLANELHDSLAQTIAGLRFQARVLDDQLRRGESQAVDAQMKTIENLLAEANAELRSLIRYFRAPIEPGGLRPALQAAVEKFRGQGQIALFFQDQWGEVSLPEKWQLEIARIIQEALANIRKHSGARNARVLLGVDADGNYTALVEDDGDGLAAGSTAGAGDSSADSIADDTEDSAAHIGLSVMAQRAHSIGAALHIDSEVGEGTRIHLSIARPAAAAAASEIPHARLAD